MYYSYDMKDDLAKILVKDIMTKAIISADSETTVYQIAKMMEKGGIGAVLVKKNGVLDGIITDRDFAVKITVNRYSTDMPVSKVVSRPLKKIKANESVLSAAKLMSAKKIRKLAVIEKNKLVGIITSTDIVSHLARTK